MSLAKRTEKGLLTPDNCVVTLIDHQPQMLFGVTSIDRQSLINNVVGFSKATKVFGVPTILSTVESKSFSGNIWPQLKAQFPDHTPIERSSMNSWDDANFVAAVKASGRKKIDAVIQWPGGVMTQIYWHTTKPSYAPFVKVPENRVYVSADRADDFLHSFLAFSGGRVVSDEADRPGLEIGRPGTSLRRIQVESSFGKLVAFVTDGHLPYPYGHETTGYEAADLTATLEKAKSLGATVLVPPVTVQERTSAMVMFPGGYVAEIHSIASPTPR